MRAIVSAATLAFLACGSASPPREVDKPPEKKGDDDGPPANLVRLYLLSDVTAISPGQEFRLAARFDVEPTWHIYWRNPGEAGLATMAAFEQPAGFVVEPTQYPGPKSFDGGGGIINYGYEDLLLLSAKVVAPEDLHEPTRFKVAGSWLACREICVPGEAEASMTLEIASAASPSAPANAAMFAAHEKALPQPFSDQIGAASWRDSQDALEILLPSSTGAEYFPSVDEQTTLAGQLSVPAETGVTLVLSYTKGADPVARGVIARRTADSTSFYQLDWRLQP